MNNESTPKISAEAEEMMKKMQEQGIPVIGAVPIQMPIRTKIWIANNRKAELLADKLFEWSKQTISDSLMQKYPDWTEEETHLPIDTSSGDFITMGDGSYIQFYKSTPCMVKTNSDLNKLFMEPYVELVDSEDENKEKEYIYIQDIYVNAESIIQCYNTGGVEVALIKGLIETDIFVVSLG